MNANDLALDLRRLPRGDYQDAGLGESDGSSVKRYNYAGTIRMNGWIRAKLLYPPDVFVNLQ
jgi:hypothetical protein